jgi:hypothetical protein
MQKTLEITNAYIILMRHYNRRRQLKCLEYKTIIMSSQRIDFEGWNWNEWRYILTIRMIFASHADRCFMDLRT